MLSIFWAVTQFCDRERALDWQIDFYAHAGSFPKGYRFCVGTQDWHVFVAPALRRAL